MINLPETGLKQITPLAILSACWESIVADGHLHSKSVTIVSLFFILLFEATGTALQMAMHTSTSSPGFTRGASVTVIAWLGILGIPRAVDCHAPPLWSATMRWLSTRLFLRRFAESTVVWFHSNPWPWKNTLPASSRTIPPVFLHSSSVNGSAESVITLHREDAWFQLDFLALIAWWQGWFEGDTP